MAPFYASRAALLVCWHDSSPFLRLLILILLFIAGISPNPGPSRPSRPNCDFPKILQFNIDGIQTSRHELNLFHHENDVRVACIQETKLRPHHRDPSFPGYAFLCRDRPGDGGGGGIAFLIRHDVEFSPIDVSRLTNADRNLKLQAIKLHLRHYDFSIFNVYVPPASSCPAGYSPDFDALLDFAERRCGVSGRFQRS